jgi:hypothetical protein
LSEFRPLGSLYTRFRWYSLAVLEDQSEVVLTLAPTDWRRAVRLALLGAILWTGFVWVAWLLQPESLQYGRNMGAGAVLYLWPLYWPLLRLLILRRRLPVLRFDKSQGVVYLLGDSRQVTVSDVIAICDVIVEDTPRSEGESSVERYELQLILRKQQGREFVLLSGSWHPSAEMEFAPIASSIARKLGIAHCGVNVSEGRMIEHAVGSIAAGHAF